MAMGIVECSHLCFGYDEESLALDDVSLVIEKGSYTTIVGHNGSGKSTLARLIAGLLEKKSGSLKVNGLEWTQENSEAIRSLIGIVFQNPDNQFIGATVRDDIAFGLENHCVEQSKMDGIINEYAEKVKMTPFLDQEPGHFSGGQKQRVAIAGVLAMKPAILIFDEATSMLDPQGKEDIKGLIRQLHEEENLTILSITHDIEEVADSDEVIVLDAGKVAETGTPAEIFTDEKRLKKLKLDVPYSMKMYEALRREGVNVKPAITMEGLVAELCQLRSGM